MSTSIRTNSSASAPSLCRRGRSPRRRCSTCRRPPPSTSPSPAVRVPSVRLGATSTRSPPGRRYGTSPSTSPLTPHQEPDSVEKKDIRMDLKLEVIVLPVSDVDRARSFYEAAGFRMDADHAAHDDYRVVQFTPPGSECAVIFGKGVTSAEPGSVRGLYLIV